MNFFKLAFYTLSLLVCIANTSHAMLNDDDNANSIPSVKPSVDVLKMPIEDLLIMLERGEADRHANASTPSMRINWRNMYDIYLQMPDLGEQGFRKLVQGSLTKNNIS